MPNSFVIMNFVIQCDRGTQANSKTFASGVVVLLIGLLTLSCRSYWYRLSFCRVYCFCPELLFGGDDHSGFILFSKLVRVLEKSGVISGTESTSAVEEVATFVVDVRARHLSDGCQSEDISDVITYLLSDYGFLARNNLCRLFKLCCPMVRRLLSQYLQ